MKRVAALYVDSAKGPYTDIEGVSAWGAERDARLYPGSDPVIAHPPCGHWGRLAWSCKQPQSWKAMGPHAVAQVRAWGGVLEHPEQSRLWAACGMPRPGEPADAWGGFTIQLDQVYWGHEARKRTWTYIVGVNPDVAREILDEWADYTLEPTRAMGVPRSKGRTLLCLPKTRRHLTPPAFAEALIALARASSMSAPQIRLWAHASPRGGSPC